MHDEDGSLPVRGASFWIRAAAHLLVDLPVLLLLTVPLTFIVVIRQFGPSGLLSLSADQIPWWWNVVFNVAITILLIGVWKFSQATPGKQVFGLKIVRSADGGVPSLWQWTLRAVGYLVASLPVVPVPVEMLGRRETLWVPLGLGFFWILIDVRNRGWHDLMSGTITVTRSPE
jgi:uncharacterized RDD family membrane protein YckC